MSRPICPYYLKGVCRFGDRCRYSHQLGRGVTANDDDDDYVPSTTRYVHIVAGPEERRPVQRRGMPDKYGYSRSRWSEEESDDDDSSSSDVVDEIVDKIKEEAKQTEEGNMWPLTSLSVIKDGTNVPGWTDHSPEEMRMAAYSAALVGKLDEYLELHHHLLREAQKTREVYLHPAKKARQSVRDMLNHESDDADFARSQLHVSNMRTFSAFGDETSSYFDSASSSSSWSTAASSPASSYTTSFGSLQVDSIPTDLNVTSGSYSTSSAASISGYDVEDDPLPGLFTLPLLQRLFQMEMDGGAMDGIKFDGNSTEPAHQTEKASAPTAAPQPPNGSPQPGAAPQPGGAPQPGPSTSSAEDKKDSASGDNDDAGVYTPMDQLSESDLEQFRAATFSLDKLPRVPPPKELC